MDNQKFRNYYSNARERGGVYGGGVNRKHAFNMMGEVFDELIVGMQTLDDLKKSMFTIERCALLTTALLCTATVVFSLTAIIQLLRRCCSTHNNVAHHHDYTPYTPQNGKLPNGDQPHLHQGLLLRAPSSPGGASWRTSQIITKNGREPPVPPPKPRFVEFSELDNSSRHSHDSEGLHLKVFGDDMV